MVSAAGVLLLISLCASVRSEDVQARSGVRNDPFSHIQGNVSGLGPWELPGSRDPLALPAISADRLISNVLLARPFQGSQ